MLCLGVFYIVRQAPFLGMVQIIVYTGAIMMLFLFVLMLVGRDSSDSVVETLRGQRVAAIVLGHRLRRRWSARGSRARRSTAATGLDDAERQTATCRRIAALLFTKYVFAFEVTSALLITAAVGAMVLAHIEREPAAADAEGAVAGALPPATTRSRCPARASSPRQLGRHARRCCPTAAGREQLAPAILGAERAAPQRAARADARSAPSTRHADGEATDDPHLLPRPRPRCCSPSARSACSCAATRSSCSCASS